MAHLLLADDNLTTQRVFELALVEETVQLSRCASAEEALDLALESSPELIFVHVDLPEMGGYELSRRVKSSPETADATVIMLVGAFQVFDGEQAEACGCVHSLAKPFETSTLLRLVRELLANPPHVELPRARFLFEIPLGDCVTQTVFDLESSQCSAVPPSLTREVASPRELDFELLSRGFEPGFGWDPSKGSPSSPPENLSPPPSDAA